MPSPTETVNIVRRTLNSTLNTLTGLIPFGKIQDANRLELFETFQRLPLLNLSLGVGSNLDWEILGVGTVANADQAFATGGGALISTDAFTPLAGENTYVRPHLGAKQTAWAAASQWLTTAQPRLRAQVSLPSIAAVVARVGFFEDVAQPVDIATTGTDDNAVFLLFTPAVSDNWRLVLNIGGVDTIIDTGVVVTANTEYLIDIQIDAGRIPNVRINGTLIEGVSALATAVSLIPQIAVGTTTAAAKTIAIRYIHASRTV